MIIYYKRRAEEVIVIGIVTYSIRWICRRGEAHTSPHSTIWKYISIGLMLGSYRCQEGILLYPIIPALYMHALDILYLMYELINNLRYMN